MSSMIPFGAYSCGTRFSQVSGKSCDRDAVESSVEFTLDAKSGDQLDNKALPAA
jgi:hypothetical protein